MVNFKAVVTITVFQIAAPRRGEEFLLSLSTIFPEDL